MDPLLLASYRETTYWVETPERCFGLRVDETHPEFDAFLGSFGTEWAFLTACNPGSRVLPPSQNRRRTDELRRALQGLAHWPGLGVGDRDWFPEASFCVVLSVSSAVPLARHFEQLAIVAGTVGETAKLIEV